jgi:hypothetical protein
VLLGLSRTTGEPDVETPLATAADRRFEATLTGVPAPIRTEETVWDLLAIGGARPAPAAQ